jgi:hypothetical protein
MNNKTQLFILLSIGMIFIASKRTLPKGQTAQLGETSLYNNYANISGVKHDFFKLFFMTFIPGLLINNPTNIFSFTLDTFNQSLFGRALIVALTIAFYHTTLQPMINFLPAF